jgi:competence ComEA-like helix-hairpin-helix protein
MGWNDAIRDYFTFTRKERIGLLLIIMVIIVVFFLPMFFKKRNVAEITLIDSALINSLKVSTTTAEPAENDFDDNQTSDYHFDSSVAYSVHHTPSELFAFDPNTLSVTGWKKLGIRDKTIQTILNFRNKGGRFRKANDLQRIYGLSMKDYARLVPYVAIETTVDEKLPPDVTGAIYHVADKTSHNRSFLDINMADTSAFINLPGIGNKLAARIVNFRNKLGGFYSIDQVGETFGLADSTFQKIKPFLRLADSTVKKFDVNIASVDELKSHPYIRWQIANAIVAYRQEHGTFTKIEDIRKIMAVTADDFKKISRYIVVQ